MHKSLALLLVLVSGCAAQLGSDGAVDEAALAAGGKADSAATVAGIYQLAGDATGAGDVVYLWLRSDGRFAWTRCYDVDCAAPVVEDGTYALTTSASTGKKYIRFEQPGVSGDAAAHFNSIYAYSASRASLELRLARTSRWQTLDAVSEDALCAASGGSWSGSACGCGAAWPTVYSPGAGGCWLSPAVGESQCDATHGSWSDDDANLAGTFCDCGYARHLTADGCADNAF